jgi:hypothetical protein
MSNALALSGVTAVLQYYLNLAYNNPNSVLGSVSVSAVAPDIVQTNLGAGTSAALQVNLFLHQVTPNAAWRNVGMPAVSADGGTRLDRDPLALDLHYLLTAYASEDMQAEALLGYGILLLHENPILPREQVRYALKHLTGSNPLLPFLSSSGLADQIELIKVTPSVLGKEEMAWLWTALKADYRPTFPFQVSVILIEPQVATSFGLPVLSRSIGVKPGPPPRLFDIQPPTGQDAPAPGDTVTVTGVSLTGASLVVLSNPRLGVNYPPFAPATATDVAVTFAVPSAPAAFPAGVYNLSVAFTGAGGMVTQSTNILSLPVAPTLLPFGAGTVTANAAGILVTIDCTPEVRPGQSVSLALAGMAVPAQPFVAPTATLAFQFPALASGSYLARLQVDGVGSPVQVDWNATPPAFT